MVAREDGPSVAIAVLPLHVATVSSVFVDIALEQTRGRFDQ